MRIRAWEPSKPPPSGARVCTAGPLHGKYRLLSLTEAVDGELPWVRMFYDVRIEAEGLEKLENKPKLTEELFQKLENKQELLQG